MTQQAGACPYVPKTTFHNCDTTDDAFGTADALRAALCGLRTFRGTSQNRLVNVAQALHTQPIPRARLHCTRPVASHSPKRPLSCFNSMHLAPHAPMRARTPSWAPIYRKYLRTTVNRARFCTWSCLLIPCELGPLADAKVIDRALVRCLAIEVARAPCAARRPRLTTNNKVVSGTFICTTNVKYTWARYHLFLKPKT